MKNGGLVGVPQRIQPLKQSYEKKLKVLLIFTTNVHLIIGIKFNLKRDK